MALVLKNFEANVCLERRYVSERLLGESCEQVARLDVRPTSPGVGQEPLQIKVLVVLRRCPIRELLQADAKHGGDELAELRIVLVKAAHVDGIATPVTGLVHALSVHREAEFDGLALVGCFGVASN